MKNKMPLTKYELKQLIIELKKFVSDLEDPFKSITFQILLQYYLMHPENWHLERKAAEENMKSDLFSKITSKTTEYDCIMIALKYIEEDLNKKGATPSEISNILWNKRKKKISNIYARLKELINRRMVAKEKVGRNEYIYFRTLRGIEYTNNILDSKSI